MVRRTTNLAESTARERLVGNCPEDGSRVDGSGSAYGGPLSSCC
jgi:hypothetical protein